MTNFSCQSHHCTMGGGASFPFQKSKLFLQISKFPTPLPSSTIPQIHSQWLGDPTRRLPGKHFPLSQDTWNHLEKLGFFNSLFISMYPSFPLEKLFLKRGEKQNKNAAVLYSLCEFCSPCTFSRAVSRLLWKEMVGSLSSSSFLLCPSSTPASCGMCTGGTRPSAHSLSLTGASLLPPDLGEQCTNFRAMPSMSGQS